MENKNEYNIISKPKHYNRENGIECIEEMIEVFGIEAVKNFCLCNIWKYRYRAADKNGEEDLNKSDWYMQKYIELQKRDKKEDSVINITYPNITTYPINEPISPNQPWYGKPPYEFTCYANSVEANSVKTD